MSRRAHCISHTQLPTVLSSSTRLVRWLIQWQPLATSLAEPLLVCCSSTAKKCARSIPSTPQSTGCDCCADQAVSLLVSMLLRIVWLRTLAGCTPPVRAPCRSPAPSAVRARCPPCPSNAIDCPATTSLACSSRMSCSWRASSRHACRCNLGTMTSRTPTTISRSAHTCRTHVCGIPPLYIFVLNFVLFSIPPLYIFVLNFLLFSILPLYFLVLDLSVVLFRVLACLL